MKKSELRKLFNDYAVTIKKATDGTAKVFIRVGYWDAPPHLMQASHDKVKAIESIIENSGICAQYNYRTVNDHGYQYSDIIMWTTTPLE